MAKKTVKKSNMTVNGTNAADVITITGSGNKIYAKGGNDKITLNKGQHNQIDAGKGNDTIIIGKKAGNDNVFMAGAGNDTITVSGGRQIIDGGAGNDIITVNGGNHHTLRGGAGSDKYIINVAMSKNTLLTIDQSDAGKKDKDILQLSRVSKNDVKLGVANGTLSIKHKTGGGIVVEGYDKKLSKIQFKDGTMSVAAVQKTSKKTKATAVTWNMGGKASVDAKKVVSTLQITGHKDTDFFITQGSGGNMVLQDDNGGKLTIANWASNTISQFIFKTDGYTKTLTADEFNDRLTIINGDVRDEVGDGLEINGTDKNDRLRINGNYNLLNGGNGDDELIVVDGRMNELQGGAGNNKFIVNGGELAFLYGDTGNDTFIINGGEAAHVFGGSGSDTFIVNADMSDSHLSIMQADWDEDVLVAGDKDVLKLTNVNMNDVTFTLSDGADPNYFLVCNVGDGAIEVAGWNKNPLDRIEFANGVMSQADINKKAEHV